MHDFYEKHKIYVKVGPLLLLEKVQILEIIYELLIKKSIF